MTEGADAASGVTFGLADGDALGITDGTAGDGAVVGVGATIRKESIMPRSS